MKLKSLFFLSLIFTFFSCSNIYQNESNNTFIIPQQNKCVVVVKSEFSQSRYAIPTAFPSDIVYFATVSYDSSNFVKNESTNDTLSFALNLPPANDSYTLTVYAFPKDTTSITEDNKKSFIASGTSSSVEMEKGQQIADFGKIQLEINDSSTAKGIVELLIDNQSDGTLSISDTSTSLFTFDSTTNKLTSKEGGIDAGIYTVVFSAKDPSNKEIELENPVQIINVFAGIKTDKWFGDNVSDDNTTLTINKLTKTTFYVCGASPSFYGASTIDSTGSDTTGTGSLAKPFATISKAVSQCTDSTKNYTIYVDGTFEELSQITIDKKISIIGLKQKATIKRNGNITGSIIKISSGIECNLKNIEIDGNNTQCSVDGAGIYNEGNLTINDCVIKNCKTSRSGGAIYNKNVFELTNTTIQGCQGNFGGGIYFNSTSTSTIDEDSKIINCIGASAGGGIIMYDSGKITFSGAIENCSTNTSAGCVGGGVGLYDSSNFSMTGGTIKGCTSPNARGVYAYTTGSFEMSGNAAINENNEIFLEDNTKINFPSNFSTTTKAKIICQSYTNHKVILSYNNFDYNDLISLNNLKNIYSKFIVTDENYTLRKDGRLWSKNPTVSNITDLKKSIDILESGEECNIKLSNNIDYDLNSNGADYDDYPLTIKKRGKNYFISRFRKSYKI